MEITVRTIIYLISLTTILSCGKKVSSASRDESKELRNHIIAYKTAVIYECINASTNSNLRKFSDENNDLGLAVEAGIIYNYGIENAGKIGAKFSESISESEYMDNEGGKPIFSDCISFGFSKEVDSLARLSYKNFRN